MRRRKYFFRLRFLRAANQIISKRLEDPVSAVLDPWHCGTDPLICTTNLRIRIRSFHRWLARCQQKIGFFKLQNIYLPRYRYPTRKKFRLRLDTDPDPQPCISGNFLSDVLLLYNKIASIWFSLRRSVLNVKSLLVLDTKASRPAWKLSSQASTSLAVLTLGYYLVLNKH